jgi:predicted Zn-dependent peptidase
MTLTVEKLANGLTVATDAMDSVESVSVGVYVGVGTRQEPEDANGVAHLLEHMAFKGTTTRSAREIAEQVEAVGGQMNAHTGREQTAYYVKVLKEDLGLGLEIVADILQNSTYVAEELDRERGVVLQELGQVEDTPDDLIFDRFSETAYPGQALGRPILGRAETIRRLPRESLVGFKRDRYGAANMIVVAAGRVDHAELVARAGREFAALKRDAADGIASAEWRGGEWREHDDELEQIHLVIGFPAVSFTDPDYWAANVLATMLGGGMSSRLFQELRERRGLCYTVSGWESSFVDHGMFGIYTGTGAAEVAELVPVLAEQLRGAGAPPPAEELARAKAQMRAGLLMSLESTSARMDALGSQILVYGRPLPPDEITRLIDGVDAEAVARVARRTFAGAPVLAAMGPIARLEPLEKIAARLR